MSERKRVSWQGVNKVESGVLLLESSNGLWYVRVDGPDGKVVLVDEKSFLKNDVREGRQMA